MEIAMEYHPEMVRLMQRAAAYAVHFKKPISLELLFVVMAKEKDTAVREWLIFNTPVDMQTLDETPAPPEGFTVEGNSLVPCRPDVLTALQLAEFEAGKGELLRPIHLLMGMMQVEESVVARMFLHDYNMRWTLGLKDEMLRIQKAKDALDEIDAKNTRVTNEGIPVPLALEGKGKGQNSGKEQKMKTRLRSNSVFLTSEIPGVDLTLKAAQGLLEPVIGREKQVKRLISILRRKIKRNACLTGEGGAGKSVLVEALAQAIADGKVPDDMKEKIVVNLNIADVVSGTKYRGEFEERMKKVIEELKSDPRIILFIDEFHMVMGAGGTKDGAMDASNILKPALANGEISVIGATTESEYLKHIESDKALKRRFANLKLPEPTAEELRRFVTGRRAGFEKHHGVEITNAAISAAIYLSIRYLKPLGASVIDAALTLVDGASATQRLKHEGGSEEAQNALAELNTLRVDMLWLERESDSAEKLAQLKAREQELLAVIEEEKSKQQPPAKSQTTNKSGDANGAAAVPKVIVDAAEIERELEEATGIPVQQPEETLLVFADKVNGKVVGRGDATHTIDGLLKARALFTEDRPIASILVLGPTGGGKTWWARAIGDALGVKLERLDMSEYQNSTSIGKLTGGVPIYVGHDQEGTLTEPVRRTPYLVLLLDEIEKGHPDLYSLLLQVMDNGRLKDGHGRLIDFRNVILVMTSNVGALAVNPHKIVGDSLAAPKSEEETKRAAEERVLKAAKGRFAPEFLNRLDAILVFHPLTDADIHGITDQQVAPLMHQLVEVKGIELEILPEVVDFLAKKGFSKELGARQLNRTVKQHVSVPLARQVFAQEFVKGDKVQAYLDGETVKFRKV